MKYTSAEANKLLRKLQDERLDLLQAERDSKSFIAATTEKLEDARPAYDYESVQKQLADIERKIRVIKHAINQFNISHVIEGFDMTIDQMLVYIPQLSERKMKLNQMGNAMVKSRINNSGRTNIIEYIHANYDVAKAREDYDSVCRELIAAQLALDKINTTETIDIDL